MHIIKQAASELIATLDEHPSQSIQLGNSPTFRSRLVRVECRTKAGDDRGDLLHCYVRRDGGLNLIRLGHLLLCRVLDVGL